MKPLPAAVVLFAMTAVGLQQAAEIPESARLAAVQRDVAAGRPFAQDDFWRLVEQIGSPIIEKAADDAEVLATFVWKDTGGTQSVIVNARVNSVDPISDSRSHLRPLSRTNIWYLSHKFPANAEFLYQLLVNPPETLGGSAGAASQRSARPDPLNRDPYPDKSDLLFDPTQPWRNGSVARMPGVPDNPWLMKNRGVPSGVVHEGSLKSAFLKMANPRTVWVYTSPGAPLRNPNLLIVFDGGTTYQSRIPTTTILDNLYAAKKIEQTVALFVDNGGEARAFDMTFNDAFVTFLANELLSWVQREYTFKAEASRTVIAGDSLGGLIGAYAALRRPDLFGKVLSQSGAFQFNNQNDVDRNEPEWLARQFATAPKASVFFHLDVGLMEDRTEGNSGTTLLASNRHLRDVLNAKGYGVHYVEVYADHDPVHWRRTLPDALMATLGRD